MHTEQRECVQVVVRCRPLSSNETTAKNKSVVNVKTKNGEIHIGCKDNKTVQKMTSFQSGRKRNEFPYKLFTFDQVFDANTSQQTVYNTCAKDIVLSVLDGYNGTIFAYGQTGTGKTYTMEGVLNATDTELQGIIPRTFAHVFQEIKDNIDNTGNDENKIEKEFLVRCSFIEIYNDSIRDLLTDSSNHSSAGLQLKEHPEKGVYIKNITIKDVKQESELYACLLKGKKKRHTSETKMNRDSSRSHSVFSIIIECADSNENIRVGKLYLVDLAGSERQSKTEAKGMRFTEAININLSLSALGNVINALTKSTSITSQAQPNTTHIPYRDSKLTRILQDSLGGNSKTVMIANIGPADYNFDETMSTLRFASRAKQIENKPQINEDLKDALVRQYKDEIARLKQKLMQGTIDGNGMFEHETVQMMIPKIIEQKILKLGMSEKKVQRMEKMQMKERERLENKLQKEKQLWLKQTKKYEKQTLKTEKQIENRNEMLSNKKIERESMMNKLANITQKLMNSSEIMNKAAKQEIELKQKKQELEKKLEKQQRMKSEFADIEKQHLMLTKKYQTQESELNDKSSKLKKLHKKYAALCHKNEESQSNFEIKREGYLESIRLLNKQIMLKDTIIQFFINENDLQRVSQRIVWNEENEEWQIQRLDLNELNLNILQPITCHPRIRQQPITEWNRIQCVLLGNENPRYRNQNIVQLQLDLPERTTQDYEF